MIKDRIKQLESLAVICVGYIFLTHFFERLHFLQSTIPGVTVIILLVAVFFPWLAGIITFGWLQLAKGLGYINGKVLLSLIFFLILTPIAFLSKLFNKDTLRLKGNKSSSNYHERNHSYEAEDLENTW